MFPATLETTWLTGWETLVSVNHSSPHGSSKSRFDKSRSACSGNAQTNGFSCTFRAHVIPHLRMKSLSPRKRVDLCPRLTVLLHSTARRDSTVANQDVGFAR